MPTTTSTPTTVPQDAFVAVVTGVDENTPRHFIYFTNDVETIWSDTDPTIARKGEGSKAGPAEPVVIGGGGGAAGWQGFTGTMWARATDGGGCSFSFHANSA